MSKININDITTQYGFKDAINARLQQIEDEFNNKVFYRNNPTGEPNSLHNDLDMGNNDILNINKITVNDIGVVGENSFQELIVEAQAAATAAEEQATLSGLYKDASAVSASQSATSATSAALSASEAQDAAIIATTVISSATTTTRGIGRIATNADLVDGATINNGPAFLPAGDEATKTWIKFLSGDVGDLVPSFATSKAGHLLCNGGEYSRTTYAALFARIGTAFGAGDGSTTFNVPDLRGRVLQGANGNLMAMLEAALPNVTGSFTTGAATAVGAIISATGAMAVTGSKNAYYWSPAGGTQAYDTARLDLSTVSAVYKNGFNSVQNPAVAVNIFIKF